MPVDKDDEELRYDPRNYRKSFKQWQIFIDASRRGESAVYRTPEGDICSPKRVEQLIHAREEALKRDLLSDLDEIDNKPWRVFRQLAEIMPEYADEYNRYKVFYSFGGGHKVMKLIEEFEKSDDYKEYVASIVQPQLKENKEEQDETRN